MASVEASASPAEHAAALILDLPPPPLPPARALRAAFARAVAPASSSSSSSPTPPFTRVYVLMHGAGRDDETEDPESRACTPRLLDELRVLFAAAAAAGAPTLDVVPLLPFAGWGGGASSSGGGGGGDASGSGGGATGAAAVAALADARALLSLRGSEDGRALAQALAEKRPAGLPPIEAIAGDDAAAATATAATAATAAATPPPAAAAAAAAPSPPPLLSFPDVAVGGTFDRLHAGHRLLLAATALAATARVFAGVTSDALLASKRRKELLETYSLRAAAAERYARRVRPSLRVRTGALRDAAEPTQAELDPEMRALVVSRETVGGGEAINEGRRRRGFRPLALVVVGLVGEDEGEGGEAGGGAEPADVAGKVSSTALREREAVAKEAARSSTGG